MALVVPPTAERQAHLGWGVGATRVTPVEHQFGRGYPGPSEPWRAVLSHPAVAQQHRSIRRLLYPRSLVAAAAEYTLRSLLGRAARPSGCPVFYFLRQIIDYNDAKTRVR